MNLNKVYSKNIIMSKKNIFVACLYLLFCFTIFNSCETDLDQLKVNNVTVNYVSNEGKVFYNEKIVPSGYKIKSEDLLELKAEDWKFLGWYIKDDKVIVNQEITKSVALVAKWEAIEDTVAPANVSKLNILNGNNRVMIEWENPKDKDFNGTVLSMIPAEGTLSNPVILEKNINSFSVGGLKNNSEYKFTIKTFDKSSNYSSGISSSSTPKNVSGDITAPSDIIFGDIIAENGNAVLKWTNPEDKDLYGIELSMIPAESSLERPIILTKDTSSFNISDLTNGKEYTFTLKTFDKSLNYSSGQSVTKIINDTSDKTAPLEVKDFNITANDGKAVLTWVNPTDEDFNGVQISMNPAEGMLSYPITLEKNATGFFIEKLTNGKEYNFTIKTLDNSFNYSSGKTISSTPVDTGIIDTTAPAEISELSNSSISKIPYFYWNNPADTDFNGVKIEITSPSNPSDAPHNNIFYLGKNIETFYLYNLDRTKNYDHDIVYNIEIKTFDKNLNFSNGYSKEICFIHWDNDNTPPGEVKNLEYYANYRAPTSSLKDIVLLWDNPDDEDLSQICIISIDKLIGSVEEHYIDAPQNYFVLHNKPNYVQIITYDKVKVIEGRDYRNHSEGIVVTDNCDAALFGIGNIQEPQNIRLFETNEKSMLLWDPPNYSKYDIGFYKITIEPYAVKREMYVKKNNRRLVFDFNNEVITVQAYDKFLYSSVSDRPIIIDCRDSTPSIQEVSGLTAEIINNEVVLKWNNPSGIAACEVSVYPPSGNLKEPVILTGKENEFKVKGLDMVRHNPYIYNQQPKRYRFTVKTLNSQFNYSDGVLKDVELKPIKPSSVTNLTVSSGKSYAKLSWTDPSDTDLLGIEIIYEKLNTAASRAITPMEPNSVMVDPGVQEAIFSGLISGSDYKFKVKPVYKTGEKGTEDVISCRIITGV